MLARHDFEPAWPQLSECSDTDVPHCQQYRGSEMKGIMCVVPIEEMLAEISCKSCLIKTLVNWTVHFPSRAFSLIGKVD